MMTLLSIMESGASLQDYPTTFWGELSFSSTNLLISWLTIWLQERISNHHYYHHYHHHHYNYNNDRLLIQETFQKQTWQEEQDEEAGEEEWEETEEGKTLRQPSLKRNLYFTAFIDCRNRERRRRTRWRPCRRKRKLRMTWRLFPSRSPLLSQKLQFLMNRFKTINMKQWDLTKVSPTTRYQPVYCAV